MEKFWHWFVQLHPLAQVSLLMGTFSLLIIIALNRAVEENLVNLIFAIQAVVISSKIPPQKEE
jgi:hypothetical protein